MRGASMCWFRECSRQTFTGNDKQTLARGGITVIGGVKNTPFNRVACFFQLVNETQKILALAGLDRCGIQTRFGVLFGDVFTCAARAFAVQGTELDELRHVLDQDVVHLVELVDPFQDVLDGGA